MSSFILRRTAIASASRISSSIAFSASATLRNSTCSLIHRPVSQHQRRFASQPSTTKKSPITSTPSSSSSSATSKPTTSSASADDAIPLRNSKRSINPLPSSSAPSSSTDPSHESILSRMHKSLPRPPPNASPDEFTTFADGGWKKDAWTPERKRALKIMMATWPAMVLCGLILYKRYFGSEEDKQKWKDYQSIMASMNEQPQSQQTNASPANASATTQPTTAATTTPSSTQPKK